MKLAEWKMKREMEEEKQKSASSAKKGAICFSAFLAFAYCAVMCIMFMIHSGAAAEALDDGKYRCSPTDIGVAETWIAWMHLAWICFLILAIAGLVMVVAAFVPCLQYIGACTLCLANCFHIVVI